MNVLNESELLQANGGFLPLVPLISTKALVWAGTKAAASAAIKTGAVTASGYYTGKSIESIVENVNATRELDQTTDQLHETTGLIREFNDKREAA